MSLSIVPPRILQAIAVNINFSTGNPREKIYEYACCKKMAAPSIELLVHSWYRLNIESVNATTGGNIPMEITQFKIHFGSLPVDPYQFLRWLNYLQDNIKFSAIQASYGGRYRGDNDDAIDVIFLRNLISEVKSAIIDSLPKYQATKCAND